jgi:hypothetical protein
VKPVNVLGMPHNGRSGLHDGDLDEDGEPFLLHNMPPYLSLPIPMPESVLVIFGKHPDDILAINVLGEGGGRVRREDLQQVWSGVQQYNFDCVAREENP